MRDDDNLDDSEDSDFDGPDLVAHGLFLMRAEVDRLADELAVLKEADEVADALKADRLVISGTGWGAAAYVQDLVEREAVVRAFPSTAWWR